MRLPIALALGLPISLAALAPAAASPQILALLSTEGAVPMSCQGAVCTAALSTYCLEEKRATPETGTLYRAAGNAAVTLIVTASDGSVREIDGRALAEFTSLREMTMVRVSVDRAALRAALGGDGDAARDAARDAVRVAFRSEEQTALLPAPSPRYGARHSAAEVAHATGPLRAAGARFVDRNPEAAVARDLVRALDALAHADETEALWTAGTAAPVVRACAAKVADEKARRLDIVGVHGYWTGRSIVGEPSLKSCLEEAHGALMTRLNRRFWSQEAPSEAPAKAAPRT